MSDIKISIIMPVYKVEEYVGKAIESILAQTFTDFEFLIVDDGTPDRSGEICDAYAKKDHRIRVIHKENGGVSAARNTGIKAATGEYLIFFDADDEVTPEVIQDNVDVAITSGADVVLFGFWYFNVDCKEEKVNEFPVSFSGTREEFFAQCVSEAVDREFFNAPWNKLIKGKLISDNGLCFDTRYSLYEDNLFATDVFIRAERIAINPKAYYRYFLRSSGSLLTRFHDNIFEGLTLFYDRAMEYCRGFDRNETQIHSFERMYVTHTYTFLKQISCNRELTPQRKKELLQSICEEEKLQKALAHVELKGRKRIIRYLIRRKQYHMIEMLYCSRSKFFDQRKA